jgi:phosphoribosylanthranilate isomerase
VTVEQALDITKVLPPFVARVGLFADQSEETIRSTLEQVPIDLLQFHGEETPAQCLRYKRPFLKALRVRQDMDVRSLCAAYQDAAGWLLDSFVPGQQGGTGVAFDWSLIPLGLGKPVVLAGGLTPDNVTEAILRVRPYGVDVSGGVECAKGIKDEEKMHRFMWAVQTVAASYAGERDG